MVHPKFFIVFVLWMLAGTIGFAQGGKGMRGGVPFTYASELAPWTGANNQQVLMKLIGSSQGRAVFQKEDGKIVTSALQSLSEESRKRIEACEHKMREAGYTQRGGFWYSAEDLAALEKKMGESTPAGASLTQTTRVAPKPTMDCRVTITKTNKNPGEFSKSGTHWSLSIQGKPFTIPVKLRSVDVTVQNFLPEEQSYTVYWYVVGRPFEFKMARGQLGPRTVVESKSETISCPPKGTFRVNWKTEEYPDPEDVKDLSLQMIKAIRSMGRSPGDVSDVAEFHALVVQLVQDGKLLRSYSSTPKYSASADVFPFVVDPKP